MVDILLPRIRSVLDLPDTRSRRKLNQKRAEAIVKAVTNYKDAALLAQLSEDLGEAMVGINENEIELLMAERGK